MTFDEVENEITRIEEGASNLLESERINAATSGTLKGFLRRVRDILDTIDFLDPVHQDSGIEAISRVLVLCNAILDETRDFDSEKWDSVLPLLSELFLRVLEGDRDVDLFVLESPFRTQSLEVHFNYDDDNASLILLLSPTVDFLNPEFRPLVAHEVAHSDATVDSLCRSYSSKRGKTGQFLADVMAVMLVGPAFPYALTNYALRVRGVDAASIERERSPSLNCRLLCLDQLSDELWTVPTVKAFSEGVFLGYRSAGLTISQREKGVVPYYLREGEGLAEGRRDCMIDETVLDAIIVGRGDPAGSPDPESMKLNQYVIGQVQL